MSSTTSQRISLFTSESVSAGHPDKLADRISDTILDRFLAAEPSARVACETFLTDNLVVLTIADQGPGVAAEDRERIFQRFTGNDTTGTGLGLSIAREFMQAMGGTITIDPQYTAGAAFVLRFPIAT